MHSQIPMLNVDLNVPPDFSGHIMLYMENGLVKSEMRLMPDEIIGTPSLFNQLLERAGYRVTPAEKG
ncbi:hypothetical protein POH93_27970 [Phytobacter diazotrophicus]|uniref:hypothetical protein n=1 Tax=Phytobacter diazotrophicus TaxID=395631 RepID=UPI00232BE6B2|nr:hypothetical protein [Phytobacter diazotrophicus]MDC0729185.1 hypothetical protein [Phytobacter diazotrophicus]MDC0736463.1 hypothetical protein [Phytobacter diazotrophicus]